MQEAEIQRHERRASISTVLKPAEVEKRRIETLAEAEKQRRIYEADGKASAIAPTAKPKRKSPSRRETPRLAP